MATPLTASLVEYRKRLRRERNINALETATAVTSALAGRPVNPEFSPVPTAGDKIPYDQQIQIADQVMQGWAARADTEAKTNADLVTAKFDLLKALMPAEVARIGGNADIMQKKVQALSDAYSTQARQLTATEEFARRVAQPDDRTVLAMNTLAMANTGTAPDFSVTENFQTFMSQLRPGTGEVVAGVELLRRQMNAPTAQEAIKAVEEKNPWIKVDPQWVKMQAMYADEAPLILDEQGKQNAKDEQAAIRRQLEETMREFGGVGMNPKLKQLLDTTATSLQQTLEKDPAQPPTEEEKARYGEEFQDYLDDVLGTPDGLRKKGEKLSVYERLAQIGEGTDPTSLYVKRLIYSDDNFKQLMKDQGIPEGQEEQFLKQIAKTAMQVHGLDKKVARLNRQSVVTTATKDEQKPAVQKRLDMIEKRVDKLQDKSAAKAATLTPSVVTEGTPAQTTDFKVMTPNKAKASAATGPGEPTPAAQVMGTSPVDIAKTTAEQEQTDAEGNARVAEAQEDVAAKKKRALRNLFLKKKGEDTNVGANI